MSHMNVVQYSPICMMQLETWKRNGQIYNQIFVAQ